MKLKKIDNVNFELLASEKELLFFMECMRESFACFDENDYQVRVGIPIKEGSFISSEFKKLIIEAGIEY